MNRAAHRLRCSWNYNLASSLRKFGSQGNDPGTVFVFLLAGPETNAATITMVARFLSAPTAAKLEIKKEWQERTLKKIGRVP